MARKGVKQHRKRRGGKRSSRGNQRRGANHVLIPYVGPTRAPTMSREWSVALCNTDYDNHTTPPASYLSRVFGLVEFLSYRPLYALEFYAMYKYARVTAVTLEVKVANISTTKPLMIAIGTVPYSEASSITPDRFWEKSTTSRKQLSVQGGLDKCTLKKTFVAQTVMGQPYLDQKYWIDVTQSASTTPVDVNAPVLLYMISDLTGGGGFTAYVNWRITYHIQFFDLKTPSSSIEVESKMDAPFYKVQNKHSVLSDDFEEQPLGLHNIQESSKGITLFGASKLTSPKIVPK